MYKIMSIYYFLIDSKPSPNNPESEDCGGGFINLWVNSGDYDDALSKAKEYIHREGWIILKIKDHFLADRDQYKSIPESLECFDQATEEGISAFFYTWPLDADDTNIEYDD
jgi:hypothetical protein